MRYALLLLVTLLVFGSASDYLGRRRVILAALAMAAGACGLFLAARGAGMLFAARALHGAAVGTASSALGAALIDLQPEGSGIAPVATTAASLLGLAAGALGTSALVQYGPAPTRLIWWLLLGAFLAAAAAVLAMPETAQARPGVLASLRPRVAVPRQARRTFGMALPCLIAVWMISGFYLTGTAVAGAGFGTAMLGAFRTVSARATPGQRASLIAAYFIVSYAAFSIPVVVAGVATTHFGLHRTALVYCTVIAVLAAVAAGSLISRRRSMAVRLRTASHAIYELVATPAVRYQEYCVPFQVDRIVELLICSFDCFFRDANGPENRRARPPGWSRSARTGSAATCLPAAGTCG